MVRRLCIVFFAVLFAIGVGTPFAQGPAPAAPYSVLSREARRTLAVRAFNGQEMFALEDLARLFNLSTREDAAAGGLVVTAGSQSIVLSPGQGLASVGGRLISLPAPPVHEGRSWFVPIDFVSRALAPAVATPVEVRKSSRLILLGDIRVPRVTGRIEPQGAGMRLTLEVAPATPHTVTQEANRLLVRFEADALDFAPPAPQTPDLVQAVRPADAGATVTVDLGPRFGSFRASDAPGERGAGRIVIDLAAQTDAQPPQPTPPPTQETPPVLDLPPAGGMRTVVIDPGHGGTEDGARGPDGTLEKDVTLSVARRLKAALEARLGLRVILTRDADTTVGLDERAAFANNNKADLFVSLHANASVRPSAAGAEVFYLSLDDYGPVAQRVAQAETEALPVFGGGTRDIDMILWEMAQARHIEESAAFAQAIEASLRERVPMSARAIQQAPFRVLVGANMPAVLVEMGFITNPGQAKQLASDDFQNMVAQGLLESITRFRDARAALAAQGGRR